MHAHDALDKESHLEEAARRCAAAGESLTPLRRRVLSLLVDHAGPTKAYDLLGELGSESGAPAKPPTVYRALDFLVRLGLAHKLQSMNAFVACGVGACERSTIFLICARCGATAEYDAGHAMVDLSDAAKKEGFAVHATMIEASGLCAACQAA